MEIKELKAILAEAENKYNKLPSHSRNLVFNRRFIQQELGQEFIDRFQQHVKEAAVKRIKELADNFLENLYKDQEQFNQPVPAYYFRFDLTGLYDTVLNCVEWCASADFIEHLYGQITLNYHLYGLMPFEDVVKLLNEASQKYTVEPAGEGVYRIVEKKGKKRK